MIETLRKTAGPLLLLDCGGVFGYTPRDALKKADAALKSMTLMGYNGINLGGDDFTLGTDYLKKASAGISFPFVSTNTIVSGVDIPRLKQYEIVVIDGVKIAVMGILPTTALNWTDAFHKLGTVKIEDPEKAIRAVLPKIMKENPDITILLSQLDFEPTAALVDAFPQINAAVSCGMKAGCNDPAPHVFHATDEGIQMKEGHEGSSVESASGEVPSRVVYIGSDGKHLGMLPMTIGADGRVALGRETLKRLDDSVPENERIFNIVNMVYYQKPGDRKRPDPGKEAAADKASHQELMEGLKMSPKEFMDQYRKTHKDAVIVPPEMFQKKNTSDATVGKGDTK